MKGNILVVLALVIMSVDARAENLDNRLRACSNIEDDTARLACYDGLTPKQAAATPEPKSAPERVAEVTEPPPAPESLGAEVLRDKDRTEEAKEETRYSATVTRCTERADGRYVFYLENGQIWRQSKNDRVHFRDCNFDVTISKDFFGYKMQQDGEKRRIRIKRVK